MFFDTAFIDMLVRSLILAVAGLCWVVFLVRIVGLRSFSKMTSFDFVMTVASGSLLAGAAQADQWMTYFQALLAMASLFLVQFMFAKIRNSSDRFKKLIQNEPVLLIRNGIILEHALSQTRVARSDLIAKLREANVSALDQVQAAVLETTGDVSILHGDYLNPEVLSGVVTAE